MLPAEQRRTKIILSGRLINGSFGHKNRENSNHQAEAPLQSLDDPPSAKTGGFRPLATCRVCLSNFCEIQASTGECCIRYPSRTAQKGHSILRCFPPQGSNADAAIMEAVRSITRSLYQRIGQEVARARPLRTYLVGHRCMQ